MDDAVRPYVRGRRPGGRYRLTGGAGGGRAGAVMSPYARGGGRAGGLAVRAARRPEPAFGSSAGRLAVPRTAVGPAGCAYPTSATDRPGLSPVPLRLRPGRRSARGPAAATSQTFPPPVVRAGRRPHRAGGVRAGAGRAGGGVSPVRGRCAGPAGCPRGEAWWRGETEGTDPSGSAAPASVPVSAERTRARAHTPPRRSTGSRVRACPRNPAAASSRPRAAAPSRPA